MVEIVCVECGTTFPARSARSRICSDNCQMRAWRRKNREHSRAYMKTWASKNPEALAKYNAQRRKNWENINCQQCGNTFQKTGSNSQYCSPKCRGKARRSRMTLEEVDAQRKRARSWTNKNREYIRKIARDHYHRHAVKKLHVQPWAGLMLGRARDAKKKCLMFTITPEWAAQRWTGYCELTGLPFAAPEQRVGYKNRNFSPSIDKIDPTKGYTPENSRFVIWAVNSLKRDGTDAQMYTIAKALVANRPSEIEGVLALPG